VTVPFTSFTQAVGWGIPTTLAIITSNMIDIQWQTNGQPKPGIDLWVDDITFYRQSRRQRRRPTATGSRLTTWKTTTTLTSSGILVHVQGRDVHGVAAAGTFTATAPGANASLYCARFNGTITNAPSSYIGMAQT